MPLNHDEVVSVLTRILKRGPLDHLPTRVADLDVLLALGVCRFTPDRIYAEVMVNERLKEWIDQFVLPPSIDHVSIRRCMVDRRFLVRDTAGRTYRAIFAKAERILAPDARSIDVAEVLNSLMQERDRRKQERARG